MWRRFIWNRSLPLSNVKASKRGRLCWSRARAEKLSGPRTRVQRPARFRHRPRRARRGAGRRSHRRPRGIRGRGAQAGHRFRANPDDAAGASRFLGRRQDRDQHGGGKNLVGIFHQPRIVIADTALLATLPHRELRAGYAEVVKYGALGDADFFHWLENHGAAALRGDAEPLTHIVAHSCRMKADIVARDERETGDRALLNLGHTFGHALEAATGYSSRLLHGEGVAIGMVLAFRLSAKLGLAPAADGERIARHLRDSGLPAAIADVPGPRPDADTLLAHMTHDKKAKNGKIVFVLARGLGHAFTTGNVPLDAVREVLAEVERGRPRPHVRAFQKRFTPKR